MAKITDHNGPLVYLPVKIPQWMADQISTVQEREQLVTRTEAVRRVLVKGLNALGIENKTA